jgi:Kdo2-lipid IVA lauroyltransferase/acyltransferase
MIGYIFFRIFVGLFGLIPFSVLYRISNGVAWLLYKGVGYRKKVVFDNLKACFPEKSPQEIERIAAASYQNLADVLLEGIKGFSISSEELRKRYIFKNPEMLHAVQTKGGSSIAMAAHFSNWEWGTMGFPIFITERKVIGFYKPLSNKRIDRYTHNNRSRTRLVLASIYETPQNFTEFENTPSVFVLVSDQNPNRALHWVRFLGQETACLHGADKYARQYGYAVFYTDIQRVKRGFYEVRFEPLALEPQTLSDGDITKLFMARLEKQLLENPNNWLWSHKRWKHKRPTDVPLL